MGPSDLPTVSRGRPRTRRLAAVGLAAYGIVLAAIAFWPEHVDSGAGGLIDLLLRTVPGLDYDRLEFGSNVLLFMPLGVLGAMLVRPAVLVPVAGLALSVLIEAVQDDGLSGRTGSMADVVANTLGAVVGTLVVLAVRHILRRSPGGDSER